MEASQKPLSFFRRWVMALVAVTWIGCGYISLTLAYGNRLTWQFTWWDTAMLIFLVVGLSLAAAVLLHLLAKWRRGRTDRWLSPLFYFVLVMGGFNLFPSIWKTWEDTLPWLTGTGYYLAIWAIGGGLSVAAYIVPTLRRGAVWGWRFFSYAWLLPAILLLQLLLLHKWDGYPADSAAALPLVDNPSDAPPVVLILMDMTGYMDVFDEEGRVYDYLPRIRQFMAEATVFHQAYSSGGYTAPSVGSLLVREPVANEKGRNGHKQYRWKALEREGQPTLWPDEFEETLPGFFRKAGGRVAYIGFGSPFAETYPGFFDSVWSPALTGLSPRQFASPFIRSLVHHMVEYLRIAKSPVAAIAKTFRLYHHLDREYYRGLAEDIVRFGDAAIRHGLSSGDFLFLHLNIPHSPFVFDAEGGMNIVNDIPTAYVEQLKYADKLVGRWLDAMRDSGKWDGSWIIVTADHGVDFRNWEEKGDEKRHVPFIVKRPGQTNPESVTNRVRQVDFLQVTGISP